MIVDTSHDDLMHDITYDFYGKRMATCSSDQRIKVWDLTERVENGNSEYSWALNDSWKAHDAAVLRIIWAHPEFGQVLISCSFDRTVRVWEEQEDEPKKSERRWIEKARLVDSRGAVQDIALAPHHFGLKLATVSVDGILRVYEAMDIVNLAHWTLMEDVEISAVVKEKETQFCVTWCKSRFLPLMLAVGCGKDENVKILKYEDAQRKWNVCGKLPGHCDVVHDISWAPNIGRSFELIATASKDGKVRIFKVTNTVDGLKSDICAEFSQHNSEVWRVKWNVIGSVLASSGDDGKVILWKANYMDEWSQLTVLTNK